MKKIITTAIIVTAVATSGMIAAASIPTNTHNIQNIQSPTTMSNERGYWDTVTMKQESSTEDSITFSYETKQTDKTIKRIDVYWRDEQELTSSSKWIPVETATDSDPVPHEGTFTIDGLQAETSYDVYVYIYFNDYWSTYTGGQAKGSTTKIVNEAQQPVVTIGEISNIGATYADVDVSIDIPSADNQEITIVNSMTVVNENNEVLATIKNPESGMHSINISGLDVNKKNQLTLKVIWNNDLSYEETFEIETKAFEAETPIINYSQILIDVQDTTATIQYQYEISEHSNSYNDTIIESVNITDGIGGEIIASSENPKFNNGTVELVELERDTEYNQYYLELIYNGGQKVVAEEPLIFKTTTSLAKTPSVTIKDAKYIDDNYSAVIPYEIKEADKGYEDPDIQLIEAVDELGNILGATTNFDSQEIEIYNLTPNTKKEVHLEVTYGNNEILTTDHITIYTPPNEKIKPTIKITGISNIGVETATLGWSYTDRNDEIINDGLLDLENSSFKLKITSEGTLVNDVNATFSDDEISVSGLEANTDYIFSITYNDDNLSSESNSISIRTLKEEGIPPTAIFEINEITSTSVDISYQIKLNEPNEDYNDIKITSITAIDENGESYDGGVANNQSLTGSISLTGLTQGNDYFVALSIEYTDGGIDSPEPYKTDGTIITTPLDLSMSPKVQYSFISTGISTGLVDFEILPLEEIETKYKTELKTINILLPGSDIPISTMDLMSTPGKLSGLIQVTNLEEGKINLLQAELVFNNGVEDVSYVRNIEAQTDKKEAKPPMITKRETHIDWINETDAVVNYEIILPENDGTYISTEIESIVVLDSETNEIVGISATNDLTGTITLANISSYQQLDLEIQITWNDGQKETYSLSLEGLNLQWWVWLIIAVATVLTFGFLGLLIWLLIKHNKKNKKETTK